MTSNIGSPEKRGILSFFQNTTTVSASKPKIGSPSAQKKPETTESELEIETIVVGETEGLAIVAEDNYGNEKCATEETIEIIEDHDIDTKNEKSMDKKSDDREGSVINENESLSADSNQTTLDLEGESNLLQEEKSISENKENEKSVSKKESDEEKTKTKEKIEQAKLELKKIKDDERLAAKKKAEEEKLAAKKKLEEEKLASKKKKEEERLELKKKKEEERLALKKQKEDERLELKMKKEEERLKLKLQREEEKRQREEEKIKKEDEKKQQEEAKERAQSRIGNFFKKVSDSAKQKPQKSDYETQFLPFYAKDGVIMPTDLILSNDILNDRISSIDSALSTPITENNTNEVFIWLSSKYLKRGGAIKYKAITLLQQMTAKEKTDQELLVFLSMIPQKYIKFYENVRPPYIGTYSKDIVLPTENPFSTKDTGYNYEYDSDLEWVNEEDEDGEGAGIDNLESGDEDDEDEDDEDEGSENEFDGFLDKEDGTSSANGKKKFLGPLIPTVLLRDNIDSMDADDKQYFELTAAESLVENEPLPIDPFKKIRVISSNALKRSSDVAEDATSSDNKSNMGPSETKKQKALITESKDLLKLFDEVQDSTFSLGTVTEISQKCLPQYSKQIIKNTVKEYAIRGSAKGEGPRKWLIKNTSHWEELRNSI